MSATAGLVPAHELRCDDKPLPRGVRQERHWSCSCGEKFFGYDATVRRAFREHRES